MSENNENLQLTITDLSNSYDELAAIADAYSDSLKVAVDAAVINYQDMLNAFKNMYTEQSSVLIQKSQSALTSGNIKLAEFYSGWADRIATQANLLGTPGADPKALMTQHIDQLTLNVRDTISLANQYPSVAKIAGALGPAGDLLEILSGAMNNGEDGATREALGALGGMLGGSLAASMLVLASLAGFSLPLMGIIVIVALASMGGEKVAESVWDAFFGAQSFLPRVQRDPLTLDLDGDGIETIGANGTVLFDHDGDGVKNGSGWIKSDDGLLVLDRNGNGTIDSGRELFGADTIKSNGQQASSGFDALKDLDSNNDNVFNASDAQFGNVRVWRDLNQDGISQSNELFTLASLNIKAINLVPTSTADINLGNGHFFARAA